MVHATTPAVTSTLATLNIQLTPLATFSGVVRDGAGDPVSPAYIYLYAPDSTYSFGQTASDGSFSVQAAPGSYVLGVAATPAGQSQQFQEMGPTVDLSAGDVTQDLTLPTAAQIQVSVVDAGDAPVQGAIVAETTALTGSAPLSGGIQP